MTTRPQLASPPAIAVLTSGELAIARPIRRAEASLAGAAHRDRDQLLRALAVAHHLLGQVEQHLLERRAKAGERGIVGAATGAGWPACPVANSSSVSEVEVSLSTVIALNERVGTPRRAAPAAARPAARRR